MKKVKTESLERKKKTPMGLALSVSDRIQLESVRLMSCSCKQLRLVGPGMKNFEIKRHATSEMDAATNTVYVTTDFELEMFDSGNDSGNPFALIKASFLLIYNADTLEGIADDAVGLFGNTNGIFNAWPYWREFVQSSTLRMSLPPLTIPVFRVFAPKKRELTKKKTAKKKTAKKETAKKKSGQTS